MCVACPLAGDVWAPKLDSTEALGDGRVSGFRLRSFFGVELDVPLRLNPAVQCNQVDACFVAGHSGRAAIARAQSYGEGVRRDKLDLGVVFNTPTSDL